MGIFQMGEFPKWRHWGLHFSMALRKEQKYSNFDRKKKTLILEATSFMKPSVISPGQGGEVRSQSGPS